MLAGLASDRNTGFDPTRPDVLTALILGLRDRESERIHLILTGTDGRYLTDLPVAGGTLRRVETGFRDVISAALTRDAAGMVVVHNHPSGDPRPSWKDISATRDLAAVARTLELELTDHIIVGWDSACSLRKAGYL